MNVQWTFLASIYNTLVTPIIGQLQAMLGGVCTTMQPVALAMVLAWLAFVAFDIANGTKTVQQAMRDFFIAGMVIGALQAGQYTQLDFPQFKRRGTESPRIDLAIGREFPRSHALTGTRINPAGSKVRAGQPRLHR